MYIFVTTSFFIEMNLMIFGPIQAILIQMICMGIKNPMFEKQFREVMIAHFMFLNSDWKEGNNNFPKTLRIHIKPNHLVYYEILIVIGTNFPH